MGTIFRRAVWALRLDIRVPLLRMRHEWFYLLQGRLAGFPRQVLSYADVLADLPEGSRLYRELVSGFEVGSDGQIQQLILRDAHRGKGREQEFKYLPIPGDRLVLVGTAIRSINLNYLAVVSTAPETRLGRFRAGVTRLLRSFLLQEP